MPKKNLQNTKEKGKLKRKQHTLQNFGNWVLDDDQYQLQQMQK